MPLKVLFLTSHIPFPPNAGDRIAILNTVIGLKNMGYDIDLLSLGRKEELKYVKELQDYISNVYFCELPNLKIKILLSVLKNRSAIFERFFSAKYLRKLRQIRDNYDIILAHHTYMGQYLLHIGTFRGILVHNMDALEHSIIFARIGLKRGLLGRLFCCMEYPKLRRDELRVIDNVSFNFSYGERGVEYLRNAGLRGVYFAPLGLDLRRYEFSDFKDEDKNLLLYFGDYKWPPNRDGVLFVLREIFPALKRLLHGARLEIVGRNADKKIRQLCRQEGVRYVGEVDDINAYIDRAGFVLATVRIGGGVRLKVLESLAKGKLTIVNDIATEGIIDKSVLLLAQNAEETAKVIRHYRDNRGDALKMKSAARRYVEKHHSLDHAAGYLLEVIGERR